MAKKDRKYWRDYIANLVKSGAVKAALSWLGKKVAWATTGPAGWLVTIIIEQVWDYFGDKFVRWALRKGALVYDKADGSIKAHKLRKARQSGSADDYDSAVDDIIG